MTELTSRSKARYRFMCWMLLRKYQPNCTICGQAFTESDLPNRGIDLITEHHLDGNHLNFTLSNREYAHRSCHKRYHVKDNIRRKQQ